MIVRSDRRYEFAADRAQVWAAMSAVHEFRQWWPWLRRFDGKGLVPDDVWRCTVQPPLPYLMRVTVRLDEVTEPHRVLATVGGDVTGTVRIELEDLGDDAPADGRVGSGARASCAVRLTSALTPDSGFVRALAFVGRPLVRFGHDWVLDTGARQFYSHAFDLDGDPTQTRRRPD